MNKEVEVIKTMAESYLIKSKAGHTVITVEYPGKGVRVSATGQFGNYGYWWAYPGEDPKKFLISLYMDYAMEKLSKEDVWEDDPSKYPQQVKETIIRLRREKRLNQMVARRIYNEMLEITDMFDESSSILNALINHWASTLVFGDYTGLPYARKVRTDIKDFWEYAWKPFIEELKKEVSNETPTD